MAKRGRPSKKGNQITIKSRETQVFVGLVFVALGVSLFINNSLSGAIPQFILHNFGQTTYILGLIAAILGLKLIGIKFFATTDRFFFGLVIFLATLLPFLNYWIPDQSQALQSNQGDAGGVIGMIIHQNVQNIVGKTAEFGILAAFMVLAVSILSGISLAQFGEILNTLFTFFYRNIISIFNIFGKKNTEAEVVGNAKSEVEVIGKPTLAAQKQEQKELDIENAFNPKVKQMDVEEMNLPEIGADPLKSDGASPKVTISYGRDLQSKGSAEIAPGDEDLSELEREFKVKYTPMFTDWVFPALNLLEDATPKPFTEDVHSRKKVIEDTLSTFKIQARVAKIFIGPSIIQYALNLAPGTKVSKLTALSKDISLALASSSESMRIASITGTSLVGIEVPRKDPDLVRIREVLESKEMSRDIRRLPLAIGKDIRGDIVAEDLQSMPHLLVAGATGTGKSVTINDILVGLLMKFSPDELRMILVDPKMVEMALYNGLPHLLTPVITEMDKVVSALDWAIYEMTQRYKLFKEKGVRNLAEFNEQSPFKMPYIIIAIDEMADLILLKKSEVETKIVRLAQLARATGIHLILATQRPSVNVITGLIKANIPARLALGVTSGVDSRVILDQTGAESLIGKGDMLVKSPDAGKIRRVQGALVTGKEIQRIADFMRDNAAKARGGNEDWYIGEITEMMEQNAGGSGEGTMNVDAADDPLFRQAVALVIQQGKGSSSSLQRYLKIGFNRAARLIDQMTEMGILAPGSGSKPREVLASSVEEVFGGKNDDPFNGD